MLRGNIHSFESFGTVDGPGIRFVAFMQGCPMRCRFCHNPDTWNADTRGQYDMTPEELLAEVRRYKSFIRSGGVTVSGGEPLLQAPFVAEFFRLCHNSGIHTALDTSGAIFNEDSMRVYAQSDLVLLDIKTIREADHQSYTGCPARNNRITMDYLRDAGRIVWIRHVLVPGYTYDDALLHELGAYLKNYPNVEKVELLAYHTMGRHKWDKLGIEYPLDGVPALSPEQLAHARSILAEYGF